MNDAEFATNEEAYKKLAVQHDLQKQALDQIQFLTLYCSSIDFVVLAGPTGVGKTHLLRRLVLAIWQAFAELVRSEPSCVPVLFTTAVAHGARSFDFKRLYRDGLLGLRDVFVDRRAAPVSRKACCSLIDRTATTISDMRTALERELKERKTKVWIIDEAQHILLGGKSGSVVDQFEVLKSIAQTAGVKLILCGTYRLPDLLRISGQVMRRSSTVQYNRYRAHRKEDLIQLGNVALSLMSALPVDEYPNAAQNIQFLHAGSLGCVGVLKDWIARAWASAHFEGRRTITLEDLERTKIDNEALELMADEIAWGDAGYGRLEWRLGRGCKTGVKRSRGTTTKRPKRRPGERHPARDVVGPMQPTAASNSSISEECSND